MNKDSSLEENVIHGTKRQPIRFIHFTTGPGTPYPDHFLVERHWHTTCEILCIRKGTFTVELDLEQYQLQTGDFCLVGSGQLHRLEGSEPDTVHDVLIFHPQILEFQYADQFQEEVVSPFLKQEVTFPYILSPGAPGYRDIARIYDAVALQREGWYGEAKLGLLSIMQILYRENLFQKTAYIHDETERLKIHRYKKIISYMENHFERRITLEELGAEISCNPQYMCRFFKEIAGVSPMQYLIAYRIEQAKRMLKTTTKSILEISMDCGFENVSYFIRQFKRYAGVTPRQYRTDKTPLK